MTTLNTTEVAQAARSMAREAQARAIMSDDLDSVLAALFPGDADFVRRNGNVSNELMRGAGEIADAVSASAITRGWRSIRLASGKGLPSAAGVVRRKRRGT